MSRFFKLMLALMVMAFLAGSQAWAQPSQTPSGWSKGNKTGWNGSDTPPGLVKKSGGTFSPYGQTKKSGTVQGAGSSKGSGGKGQGKAKGKGTGQ